MGKTDRDEESTAPEQNPAAGGRSERRHRAHQDGNLDGAEGRRARLKHEIDRFGPERRAPEISLKYGLIGILVVLYLVYHFFG